MLLWAMKLMVSISFFFYNNLLFNILHIKLFCMIYFKSVKSFFFFFFWQDNRHFVWSKKDFLANHSEFILVVNILSNKDTDLSSRRLRVLCFFFFFLISALFKNKQTNTKFMCFLEKQNLPSYDHLSESSGSWFTLWWTKGVFGLLWAWKSGLPTR